MIKLYTAVFVIIYCLLTCSHTYGGYTVPIRRHLSTKGQSVPENNWDYMSALTTISFNSQDTTSKQTKYTTPKRAKEENWEAITSIVLGTAGWILSLFTGVFWIYFFLSIPAIIFGIKGLKRYKKRKYLAILGLLIGLSLGSILFLVGLQIFPDLVSLFI